MDSLSYPLSSKDKNILKDVLKELMPSLILDIAWDDYFHFQSFFESLDGYYRDYYVPIASSATSGGLVKITTAAAETFSTGDRVEISGHNVASVNGIWVITVVDSTHFTLNGSTYVSNGTGGYAIDSTYSPPYPTVSGGGITLDTGLGGACEISSEGDNLTPQSVLSWDKAHRFRTSVSVCSIASYNPNSIPPQVSSYGTQNIYATVLTGSSNPIFVKNGSGSFMEAQAKYVGFLFSQGNIYGIACTGLGVPGSGNNSPTKQILLQAYKADLVYLLEVDIDPNGGAVFYVNGVSQGVIRVKDLPHGQKVGLVDFAIQTNDAHEKQLFSRFYEYIQQK